MSKYSKMLSMKNGSNMRIKKASVGMFRLLGMGAKKGVEMIGVSKKQFKKALQKLQDQKNLEKHLRLIKKEIKKC
jgi:hypothetical protein